MMMTFFSEVVSWECDELGHLNMRHYMTKTEQARQMFFMRLGLEDAFKSGSDSTVRTREFTVRYLKESRPAERIRIETGILSINEDSADLLHIFYHGGQTVSAVILETVHHIYLRTGEAFRWPQRVREAAPSVMCKLPSIAMTRGLPDVGIPAAHRRESLIEKGAKLIGMGVFLPTETDVFECVTPQTLCGRASDSIGNFTEAWGGRIEEFTAGNSTISGALLEIRGFIHRPATAGNPFEFYSALHGANPYTRQITHHIVNPITGESWASMIASSCLFDVKSRKLVKADAEEIAQIMAISIPNLGP